MVCTGSARHTTRWARSALQLYFMISIKMLLFFFTGDITISEDLTLNINSDLNGASPQFTLTCISTGGPATTVTWTRDSGPAMGNKMTVLSDATTAQYTHTLTVTGRLEGLYTCTVANNKPSEDSATYTVRGTVYL